MSVLDDRTYLRRIELQLNWLQEEVRAAEGRGDVPARERALASYWFKDPNTGAIDQHAMAEYEEHLTHRNDLPAIHTRAREVPRRA